MSCVRATARRIPCTLSVYAGFEFSAGQADIDLAIVHEVGAAQAIDVDNHSLDCGSLAGVARARLAEIDFPSIGQRHRKLAAVIELDLNVASIEFGNSVLVVRDVAFAVRLSPLYAVAHGYCAAFRCVNAQRSPAARVKFSDASIGKASVRLGSLTALTVR